MPKTAPPRTRIAKRTRSTNAPDTVRGILLQVTRFLYYLLKSDADDVVSLELFEDVGVEHPDGSKTAEQDKSFRSLNPLADRSIALWKTLHNWVNAANIGVLVPAHTNFVIYAPKATMGTLARTLNDANSHTAAEDALTQAQGLLLDCASSRAGATLHPHVEAVMSVDRRLAATIVERFTADTQDQPQNALRTLLRQKLIGEDALEEVLTWCHGWVKQAIEGSVSVGQPAQVAQRDFHQALLNYVRHHDRTTILRSVAGKVSDEEVEAELNLRDYIRQLRLIALADDDFLAAANDFLSSAADRTDWSDRGLISEAALEAFATELAVTWRNKQIRTKAIHPTSDGVREGQLLFSDCMEHTVRLEGLETPATFVRGSWHALADDLTIGWHPEYKKLLTAKKKVADGPDGD